MLHDERHDGWVDGTATGTHHKAVKRRKTHGGIHGHAMVDGGCRAAVAQMQRDQLQVLKGLIEHHGGALGDRAMRGAMGAVFADGILLVKLIRERVHVRLRGQRGEKRGVEHGDHGDARHMLHAGMDAHKRGTVVQRRQLGKLVDLRDDIVVDENGTIEVFASLHDAMTDGVDLGKRSDRGVLARDQGFKHERHSVVMVRHLRVDDHFVVVKTVLVERLGRTDALANALGHERMRFNIDKLVLQRR